MKRTIINTLAAIAVLAGLACSTFAPWWAVWFICFPVMYAGVLALIKLNTKLIEEV